MARTPLKRYRFSKERISRPSIQSFTCDVTPRDIIQSARAKHDKVCSTVPTNNMCSTEATAEKCLILGARGAYLVQIQIAIQFKADRGHTVIVSVAVAMVIMAMVMAVTMGVPMGLAAVLMAARMAVRLCMAVLMLVIVAMVVSMIMLMPMPMARCASLPNHLSHI